MKRMAVFALIALIPLASAATSIHIEWDVNEPVDADLVCETLSRARS